MPSGVRSVSRLKENSFTPNVCASLEPTGALLNDVVFFTLWLVMQGATGRLSGATSGCRNNDNGEKEGRSCGLRVGSVQDVGQNGVAEKGTTR